MRPNIVDPNKSPAEVFQGIQKDHPPPKIGFPIGRRIWIISAVTFTDTRLSAFRRMRRPGRETRNMTGDLVCLDDNNRAIREKATEAFYYVTP